jgi:hypothetical protein
VHKKGKFSNLHVKRMRIKDRDRDNVGGDWERGLVEKYRAAAWRRMRRVEPRLRQRLNRDYTVYIGVYKSEKVWRGNAGSTGQW